MADELQDALIYHGGSIKSLDDGKIGGYLVTFTDEATPDLDGDYFTKDTDFGSATTTPIWFHHRQPLATKNGSHIVIKEQIGDGQLSVDDNGVFLEAVLYNREKYEQMLGSLGWSSGTAPHLVDTKQVGNANHITHWPLGLDASLTPTPAEPKNKAMPLKSLKETIVAAPEGAGDVPAVEPIEHNVNINITVSEEAKMGQDLNTPEVDPAEKAVPAANTPEYVTKSQFESLNDRMNALMEKLEKSPALKDAGVVAPDDEAGKPEVKNFADFLLSIFRGNTKRLAAVYKSRKDLSGETGTAGGYLVPEEYTTQLLQVAEMTSRIIPLVTTVPVNSDTGRYPALDQYITPTAGSGGTAYAAGVTTATTAAGETLTETEPGFEMIQWRVNKIGGYTEVENELIADSPQSIEVLLTRLFGVAVRAKTEHYILRGSGAGEPLGVLNAGCAVGVTPDADNTFAWADALEMQSRFKPVGGSPVWVIHPGMWPDIGVFETSAGGGVFQANMQAALGNNILGYEILQSEHLPQDDNAGCVILADFSAYLLFQRSGLSIAFSEHAAFTSDKGTWRFTQRMDGQPWLKSAITLADPQGSYTMSPFVYLND